MSTTLWQKVKSLFDQAENSSPSHPAVHEMIERSQEELVDYDGWKKTLSSKRLLDWLIDQYAVFRGKGSTDLAIDFLDTPSTKGFVIHFSQTQYSKREITHFFDFLKERVKELNYRSDISDRRIFSRNDWVETQERHYLKPRNRYEEGEKMNQGFGNITIELELRDDRVRNLRLRATVYKDALYDEAESFRALIIALAA